MPFPAARDAVRHVDPPGGRRPRGVPCANAQEGRVFRCRLRRGRSLLLHAVPDLRRGELPGLLGPTCPQVEERSENGRHLGQRKVASRESPRPLAERASTRHGTPVPAAIQPSIELPRTGVEIN